MIYHQAPSICVHQLRVVTPQTLLMTVESYNSRTNTYNNQLWKMKPDGSGRTVLFDLPKNATTYNMNVYTQFPWPNVSRDGSMYTLLTTNQNNLLQTLVFGSLKGGKPIQFAYTSRGSVDIAGWTTWR